MTAIINASTFDLAAYRADLEANAATDPIKRVSLWFLNAMSHHDPLAQSYRVLKNKPGTCNIVYVLTDKNTGKQITSLLSISAATGQPQAKNVIYPGTEEGLVTDVDITDISDALDVGDLQSVHDVVKQIVLPGVVPEVPPSVNVGILNFDGGVLSGFDGSMIVGFDTQLV